MFAYFANIGWGSTDHTKLKNIYSKQKHASRIIYYEDRLTHARPLFKKMTPLVFFGSLPIYSILRIYRYNYFVMLTFFGYVEIYVNYLQRRNKKMKREKNI